MSRTTSDHAARRLLHRVGAAWLAFACATAVGRSVRASDLGPEMDAGLAVADEGDLDPLKVGFRAALFVPGVLAGGGVAFAWEPEHWLETSIGLAFTKAVIEEPVTGGEAATGEVGGSFFFITTRFWFGRRHAAVVSISPTYTYYAAEVAATDALGNSFRYRRQGSPFTLAGGASYGYRTGVFRINLGGGVLLPLSGLEDAEAIATSSFPDAVGLKAKLDDDTDAIAGVRLYAEVSLGFLFY